MINYKFRQLTGNYKGSLANALADWLKINSGMLELGIDLPLLDSRITALESTNVGIVTNANFIPNSILGSIIQQGTLPGSALQANSITNIQLVSNSLSGIIDANISANANINPSKIDVGQISHTQLQNIGSNTHPQIDTDLAQLFSDVGTTPGHGLSTSLVATTAATNASLSNTNSNLTSLTNFVVPAALSTNSQIVSGAINELRNGLAQVGASGFGISGPSVSTNSAVATWNSTNGSKLANTPLFVDSNGNITFTESITIGSQLLPVQALYTGLILPGSGNVLQLQGGGLFGSSSRLDLSAGGSSPSNTAIYSTSASGAISLISNISSGTIQLQGLSLSSVSQNPALPGFQRWSIGPSGLVLDPTQKIFTGQIGTAGLPVGSGYFTNLYLNGQSISGSGSGGSPTGTAGGDLSGTYPNPTVVGINGISVVGSPTTGQVLQFNGTNYVPVTVTGNGSLARSFFSW